VARARAYNDCHALEIVALASRRGAHLAIRLLVHLSRIASNAISSAMGATWPVPTESVAAFAGKR